MLQMRRHFAYDAYILKDSFDILSKIFKQESIEVPVLEEAFCDISKEKFEVS